MSGNRRPSLAGPYVPPAGATEVPRRRRAGRELTPFSGTGLAGDEAPWPMAALRDPATRAGAAGRTRQRHWQAIEIQFEEWGSGSLVIVGVERAGGPAASSRTESEAGPRDAERPTRAASERPDAAATVTVRLPATLAGSLDGLDIPERIAAALETVALRIRVGEFRVRGIVDGMSDVAILAATLAALLAPRP